MTNQSIPWTSPNGSNAPKAEQVLTTLSQDGKRIWMRPRPSRGPYLFRRRIVGYALIVTFLLLPFVYVNGHPAILLDVASRRFHLLGATFHPTDSPLLMFLMLSIFLGIFWLTALVGRAWCGWGCPQTVYMELLFRPLERWFEGPAGKQRQMDKKAGLLPAPQRAAKYLAFLLIAFVLGNQFLAYFVGWEQLAVWVTSWPSEHPGGFSVMAITTGLVMFDFSFFREQMCTVICPYARLQSALLDRHSVIVGYDALRGEARKRVKTRTEGDGSGDCIDCGACVKTCPTGIDIRNGLQLECIACTQCIDACDDVMEKIQKPKGLIRLTSKHALATPISQREGAKSHILRTRTVLYPAMIAVLLSILGFSVWNQQSTDVTVLRQLNAPYVVVGDEVRNQLRIKVVNRDGAPHIYTLKLRAPSKSKDAEPVVLAPQFPLTVGGEDSITTPVFVTLPKHVFEEGKLPVSFTVRNEAGFEQEKNFLLLGPSL